MKGIFKKTIILSLAAIAPFAVFSQKMDSSAKNSVARVKNLKVWRAYSSALIEFDPVKGATGYIVYKKEVTDSGKSKGKYKKVGIIKEKDWEKVQTSYRQVVDFYHAVDKYYGVKNVKYSPKKNYRYKVVAYKAVNGKKVLSKGKTKVGKKHKKSKVEYGYEVLPMVNKLRAEYKKKQYVWAHPLEKGCIIRAKEVSNEYEHTRPDGSSWATAFRYIKHNNDGAITTGGANGENIWLSDVIEFNGAFGAWKRSRPHLIQFMYNDNDDVVTEDGGPLAMDDDNGNEYLIDMKKGDIGRNTGGMCCIAAEDKGPYGYEFATGSINNIWEVDGKRYYDYFGTYIRDGKYINMLPAEEYYAQKEK